MKKTVLILSLVFLFSFGAAEIQYSMEMDENAVYKNTTVVMECSSTCPGLEWRISDDERVLDVRDGNGEVDYTVRENTVDIQGVRFPGRDNRTLRISSVIDRDAEEVYAGLYKRTLRLSGFEDKRTSGSLESGNLISGRTGFGFETSYREDEMLFQGEGPVNIRAKFGDGNRTRYLEFFGSPAIESDSVYEIPVGTLGFRQGFERFPVAVMPDSAYSRNVNNWSAGEYVGGVIRIRSSLEDDFNPVLAHEVVHGLNDRELNWDNTRTSYFDEGVGKYVEHLLRKERYRNEDGKPPRELFGNDVRWDPDPDDNTYTRLPPKGEREKLWQYYSEDMDFMKDWSAMSSTTNRRFGYAYSELLVKNYVAKNGSIKQLYNDLNVTDEIEDRDMKWEIFSRHMDMTPCKYDERDEFRQCIEDINSYDYPVYSGVPGDRDEDLNISRIELPNRTEKDAGGQVKDRADRLGEKLLKILERFLQELGVLTR